MLKQLIHIPTNINQMHTEKYTIIEIQNTTTTNGKQHN